MARVEIAIVGGGLAGCATAAMLGRRGISVALIEPKSNHRSELRCEKVNIDQRPILARMQLDAAVQGAGTRDGAIWTARFGRLIDKKASDQLGLSYHQLVDAIRGEISPSVRRIQAKAIGIVTSDDRQQVVLDNGDMLDARLVVVSSGLGANLLQSLGIERQVISDTHCVTFGFDVAPTGDARFDFPALTYFSERTSDRTAYLSLFPIGTRMRANLFVYRDRADPWLQQMRVAPAETLHALLPGLKGFTGSFAVTGEVQMRPVDLYRTLGHVQPGVVLIGDAFATSCPAAGTGATKVYTDVERLCDVHIPQWLATPGMAAAKIAAFYEDPVKRACDQRSEATAFHFRSVSTEPAWPWRLRRLARFHLRRAQGWLVRLRHAGEWLGRERRIASPSG